MTERQILNRNLAQMLKGGVIMDVTTPEQALHLGSDYIVMGRPITRAQDPLTVYQKAVNDFVKPI